jgi:cation diffusion facilitator family transporter
VKTKSNRQIAMNNSGVTILINLLLGAFKLFAGIFAASTALVSDAVHTISDVLSTFIVIIGIKMSDKDADNDHPYGHERFENVAAIILATVLCLIGIGIGYRGAQKIISGEHDKLIVPGALALVAALASIVIKEWMYWYTRGAAKKIDSPALMADAWHHRSDAFSSIGSLAGVVGARLGFPVSDSIASIVICLFVVKAAVSIFLDAVGKMTDKSCDGEIIEQMKSIILKQEGVIGIDQIKTRLFGNKIYVDVEICADGEDTLSSAHEIAHNVHDVIENYFEGVKHCMVHVNPEKNDSRRVEKKHKSV